MDSVPGGSRTSHAWSTPARVEYTLSKSAKCSEFLVESRNNAKPITATGDDADLADSRSGAFDVPQKTRRGVALEVRLTGPLKTVTFGVSPTGDTDNVITKLLGITLGTTKPTADPCDDSGNLSGLVLSDIGQPQLVRASGEFRVQPFSSVIVQRSSWTAGPGFLTLFAHFFTNAVHHCPSQP